MIRHALWLALLVGCTQDAEKERPPGTIYDTEVDLGWTDADVLDSVLLSPELQEFNLRIDLASMNSLRTEPLVWVPADFAWNGLVFRDVGVRLKGNGSFRPIDGKPSLKIEFDKFNPGQDFFGLDVLVLNNTVSDETDVKEVVAYALYRAAGVPAARAGLCGLTLNGENYGLYTHMEDVDEHMLANWFERADGPLFELFDVILQPDDVPLFQLEEGPDDRTALAGAAQALTLPRAEAIEAVAEFVDMDAFLAYYAASGLLGQFDAWPFNNPSDDVHLYVDPTSGRIHPIPHGLDESLRDPFRHVSIPGDSLLGQACYFTPDCKAALAARTWEMLDVANEIDLTGQLKVAYEIARKRNVKDQVDNTQLNDQSAAYQEVKAFLEDRELRLIENLGPR